MSIHTNRNSPNMMEQNIVFDIPAILLSTQIDKNEHNKKRCCAVDCKKKLTLTDTNCRCGQRYCVIHRLPETHACTFDFKEIGISTLQKTLVRVDGYDLKLYRI
jgi:predicted nucleic acid binding AN1-type Zn finger protein